MTIENSSTEEKYSPQEATHAPEYKEFLKPSLDMARFLGLMCAGGSVEGNKIIFKAGIKEVRRDFQSKAEDFFDIADKDMWMMQKRPGKLSFESADVAEYLGNIVSMTWPQVLHERHYWLYNDYKFLWAFLSGYGDIKAYIEERKNVTRGAVALRASGEEPLNELRFMLDLLHISPTYFVKGKSMQRPLAIRITGLNRVKQFTENVKFLDPEKAERAAAFHSVPFSTFQQQRSVPQDADLVLEAYKAAINAREHTGFGSAELVQLPEISLQFPWLKEATIEAWIYGRRGKRMAEKLNIDIKKKHSEANKIVPKVKEILVPEKSTDLAWFLGTFSGGGNIKGRQVQTRHTSVELVDEINKVAKDIFGIEGKKSIYERKDSDWNTAYKLCFSNSELAQYLGDLRLVRWPETLHQMHQWIFEDEKFLWAFIRGYYDVKGNIVDIRKVSRKYHARASIGVSRRKAAEELSSILTHLGFTNVQTRNSSDSPEGLSGIFLINYQNLINLADNIYSCIPKKEELLAQYRTGGMLYKKHLEEKEAYEIAINLRKQKGLGVSQIMSSEELSKFKWLTSGRISSWVNEEHKPRYMHLWTHDDIDPREADEELRRLLNDDTNS